MCVFKLFYTIYILWVNVYKQKAERGISHFMYVYEFMCVIGEVCLITAASFKVITRFWSSK